MTLTFADPADPWFILGFIVVLLWIATAIARSEIRDGRKAQQAVEDLCTLDPAIMEVFEGHYLLDDFPSGDLSYAKLHRVAESKRNADKRSGDVRELESALAALAAARQPKEPSE